MRSIVSGLGLMGVLLGLAMPVSAEVLLQAGATETKLVTTESHQAFRHKLTAEAGQTVAIKLKLANNNPDIVSRVAVYAEGKATPLLVSNQVNYRTVDPEQKAQISHLIVLTLPADRGSGRMTYEIEPLFDYDNSPQFEVEQTAESVIPSMPATVRYRMTVETATVSQRLLLDAHARQSEQDYDGAIALYTRAINLNPDIADFYAQRGQVYLAQAEASGSNIEQIDRTVVTDWETAARLYEQVGHTGHADALRSQLIQLAE
ncbi:MAG: tetratricopeptide repeat protein [Cyanobacteria bacterium J06642_11]